MSDGESAKPSSRKACVRGALVGVGLAMAGLAYNLTDGGLGFGRLSVAFLAMGCFIAALAALISGISWIVRRDPRDAQMATCGLVFLAATVPALRYGAVTRHNAFEALAIRAVPLTQAIERFAVDEGRPPATLQELVPHYIGAIPATELPGNPPFTYRLNENEPLWELRVNATWAFSFDTFMYWPTHDYPEWYGGPVERIGDWAYVHE